MLNIQRKTTTSIYTITTSTVLIVLLTLLTFSSGSNIQSFGQQEEEDNSDDNTLIISGRINSMLMPTMTGMNDNTMNNSTSMSQMMTMSGDNTSSSAETDVVTSQAMRYSMARDVAWILSGDWIMVSNPTGSSNSNNVTTTFDAEFIKATTNGTMLHTHRLSNFVPTTNANDISAAFNSNTDIMTITGKSDVYFNDELAWPQADTTLSIMNGTILMINIDSEDIDHHFHNQPIYGTVNMLADDNGFTISLPTPQSIQETIEQELAQLGVNATHVQSTIEARATEVGGSFAEEAIDVFDNITNSIRDIIVAE